jgi:tRNA nucleotidyltransferase (CCA-adding enzyme)
MRTEKSCGAVVFTKENGALRYVIVRSKQGVYGFPKGHVEGQESELQTALREVLEETGLTVLPIQGFREETAYSFSCGEEVAKKQVVFFLAEYSEQMPKPQESEIDSILLMDYETALAVLPYDDTKAILTKAHAYLSTCERGCGHG